MVRVLIFKSAKKNNHKSIEIIATDKSETNKRRDSKRETEEKGFLFDSKLKREHYTKPEKKREKL